MNQNKEFMQADVRAMNLNLRDVYVTKALEAAKGIVANLADGAKLYAAFEPLLRYVVRKLHDGACHDTSALLYMYLRHTGLKETEVELLIGEVNFPRPGPQNANRPLRFDHSWLEINGNVFDVAVCVPSLADGEFAGGPVFAGIDLSTGEPTQGRFGVFSVEPLDQNAKPAHARSLGEYLQFQQQMSVPSMAELAHHIYGLDGLKLVENYKNVRRKWKNPVFTAQGADA